MPNDNQNQLANIIQRTKFSAQQKKEIDQCIIKNLRHQAEVNSDEELFQYCIYQQQGELKGFHWNKVQEDVENELQLHLSHRYVYKHFKDVILEKQLQPYSDDLKRNVVDYIEKNIKAQSKEIQKFNQKQLSKFQSNFIIQVKLQFDINPVKPFKYQQMSDIIMNTVKYYTECIRLAQISNDTDACDIPDREILSTASYISDQNLILQTRDTTNPEASSQEAFTSIDSQDQTIPPTPQNINCGLNQNEYSYDEIQSSYCFTRTEMEIYIYQENYTQILKRYDYKETEFCDLFSSNILTFEGCGFVEKKFKRIRKRQ
ncbi:Hypothetical_protein [Hexamita inflata]|uniref:Hypothetical_protein n=1 Tax=Hexamita inflata TaxID=28002 RepID=A0AA86PJA1_9EUKA|nr:Hypothetical protein HINF_LOCUS28234 [Hexamita inflata]